MPLRFPGTAAHRVSQPKLASFSPIKNLVETMYIYMYIYIYLYIHLFSVNYCLIWSRQRATSNQSTLTPSLECFNSDTPTASFLPSPRLSYLSSTPPLKSDRVQRGFLISCNVYAIAHIYIYIIES